MTIQELYDWAKENNCLDKTLAKNCNLEVYDIESAICTDDESLPTIFGLGGIDKVILD